MSDRSAYLQPAPLIPHCPEANRIALASKIVGLFFFAWHPVTSRFMRSDGASDGPIGAPL